MASEVTPITSGSKLEQVLIAGNLSSLSDQERVQYYNSVCHSVGLNPLTKPFEYITLNGKLTLYARKDCTDQLRSIHDVSLTIAAREVTEGIYVVTARATKPGGRTDESIGAVPIENLTGDNKSNALMKAETKAKRRVTLSICGLGLLDESEIESIPAHAKHATNGSRETQQEVLQRRLKETALPVVEAEEVETSDADKEVLAAWNKMTTRDRSYEVINELNSQLIGAITAKGAAKFTEQILSRAQVTSTAKMTKQQLLDTVQSMILAIRKAETTPGPMAEVVQQIEEAGALFVPHAVTQRKKPQGGYPD